MSRTALGLLIVAASLVPRAVVAEGGGGVTIEGFYGLERPPSTSFSAAVSGTTSSPDLFSSSLQMAGGDILVDLGGLELGAIVDTTFGSNTASQTAIGALGGLALGTGSVRLDLLAEAGGHRYGNLASNPEIVTASSTSEWLFYVGLRPGISVKLGGGPLSVGLWGFARWDVNSKDVPVTVGSAGSAGSYKLGGSTIGATLRLGFTL
ncbi:hypothetical protein [Anaeromyxobacter oryzae]|uniref:Outer membrane protein beta-barrel domain-containing protein n=1 Tax=Anaeromyxobacter oryzae TaxID=2918170 RepID=A0ABM7WSG9_9BACT|nr:hypothetical protein [Anaeromyxobacter oryzae]BDG02427.1 hypothetical protein AMOR_14230 [Anaeromyxobacter oryzae]